MVRVVLTVALTVAMLAVVLPAADRAGVGRSEAAVESAIDRLVSEGRALNADSDALPADLSGARRVLTVDLPKSGALRAGLAELELAPPSSTARGTRIAWRVRGGQRHVTLIDGLAFRHADERSKAVVFETGGRRRVVLELVRAGGRRVILIDRRSFK